MSEQVEARPAAWARLNDAVEALDDRGLGALEGMAHWSRANLPAEVAVLVDVLDAARAVAVATLADRGEVSVLVIETLISEIGGESHR